MTMKKKGLIIFIRNPLPGKVKTRIAQTMGDQKALVVYRQLLAHTHAVSAKTEVDRYVFYSDFIDQHDQWDEQRFQKRLQQGSDLGERMDHAFRSLFAEQYAQLVIIGSDCLELTRRHIADAFNHLQTHDVVIGPSQDGGYYLLGLRTHLPRIFQNKSWSTDKLFEQTIREVQSAQLRWFLLPMLSDIDEEKDIPDTWNYESPD